MSARNPRDEVAFAMVKASGGRDRFLTACQWAFPEISTFDQALTKARRAVIEATWRVVEAHPEVFLEALRREWTRPLLTLAPDQRPEAWAAAVRAAWRRNLNG